MARGRATNPGRAIGRINATTVRERTPLPRRKPAATSRGVGASVARAAAAGKGLRARPAASVARAAAVSRQSSASPEPPGRKYPSGKGLTGSPRRQSAAVTPRRAGGRASATPRPGGGRGFTRG